MAAELGNQSPARPQGPPDARDHGVGAPHPVQGGVGEHGVELGLEAQILAVHYPGVETARARRRDHVGGGVDRDHGGAGSGDALRQHAVAAAQVENPLVRLRRQKIDQRHSQFGDETRVPRVTLGIPALRRGALFHAQLLIKWGQ